MSNEEFEDLFGNVPFKDIKKIKKYINENYVSKDELWKKYCEEVNELWLLQRGDVKKNEGNRIEQIKIYEKIVILSELLEEN